VTPSTPVESTFSTRSREEFEVHYLEWYGRNRVRFHEQTKPFRLSQTRWDAGVFCIDTVDGELYKSQHLEPLGMLHIVDLERGPVRVRRLDGLDAIYDSGDVFALAQPHEPVITQMSVPLLQTVALDLRYVRRVVGAEGGSSDGGFLGYEPQGPEQVAHWRRTVSYVRDAVLDCALVRTHTLALASAAQALAAAAVVLLPNSLRVERSHHDVRDAGPQSLRRAVAFIEENLTTDITLQDIAAAARVSARAVQLAFRHHHSCTPVEFVRRRRLAGAREDLAAAIGGHTRVIDIATRWGFSSASRFARYYQETYGELPSETLQR
jgi:AraC-like DNA-binding protein